MHHEHSLPRILTEHTDTSASRPYCWVCSFCSSARARPRCWVCSSAYSWLCSVACNSLCSSVSSTLSAVFPDHFGVLSRPLSGVASREHHPLHLLRFEALLSSSSSLLCRSVRSSRFFFFHTLPHSPFPRAARGRPACDSESCVHACDSVDRALDRCGNRLGLDKSRRHPTRGPLLCEG